MKIAVIGGGIFGLTTAIVLRKEGFYVDLFEEKKDVFMSASGINQFRLHRGYHYPRSIDTIDDCLLGEMKFREFYPEVIIDSPNEHYYVISKEKSFLNAEQCFKIWSTKGLEYELEDLDILNKEVIDKCVKVKESIIDPEKFKQVCLERCKKYGVRIFLNQKVNYGDLQDYDLIVNATYSSNNFILDKFPKAQKDYQFELIEKIVLKLPKRFDNKSVVIIDGPFTCIDPYGRTGLTLIGNVVHAIHHKNIGKFPEIPEEYKDLLNNGIIKNPRITNINDFLNSAENFFPGIKKEAEYIGSMFTIRTVLPNREHDDARPTIVEKINDKIVSVFSGKIPTCIDAAEQVLKIARNKREGKTYPWGEVEEIINYVWNVRTDMDDLKEFINNFPNLNYDNLSLSIIESKVKLVLTRMKEHPEIFKDYILIYEKFLENIQLDVKKFIISRLKTQIFGFNRELFAKVFAKEKTRAFNGAKDNLSF